MWQQRIEDICAGHESDIMHIFNTIREFRHALETGELRAAEPDGEGGWKVNGYVKRGILLMFKYGVMHEFADGAMKFFDKDTLPLHEFTLDSGVRVVPGGSAARGGSYLAPGTVLMPPCYVNIGAYVDEGSMIDSHALVGACAQIGKRVHVSAAAQIGGVLEPEGARPVIIEDDVMIGGNCGVYEGALVRTRAVLGSGVVLNASSAVYDLVHERIIRASEGVPLEIPEAAVVVAGARQARGEFAEVNGLSIYTPLIVKYRDSKTDAKTALNEILRK